MYNYSKDILEQVTKDHPYFSAAQFYLLQQTDPSSATYNKQAARTAIFFNNPYWLNFQLHQPLQAKEENEEIKVIPLPEIIVEENAVNNDDEVIIEKEIIPVTTIPVEANTDNDDDAIMEEEIEPMKLELKMPAQNSTNNDLLFEPMHLVDYFASLGIKLSEEIQPADKLGKQLKSFTEWLKTMKKVHTGEDEAVIPEAGQTQGLSDAVIQILAEKSNVEGEILTEAMADVFAKQGKQGKATELYQKLSLLNPSKSAYFAAKIENLKGS